MSIASIFYLNVKTTLSSACACRKKNYFFFRAFRPSLDALSLSPHGVSGSADVVVLNRLSASWCRLASVCRREPATSAWRERDELGKRARNWARTVSRWQRQKTEIERRHVAVLAAVLRCKCINHHRSPTRRPPTRHCGGSFPTFAGGCSFLQQLEALATLVLHIISSF